MFLSGWLTRTCLEMIVSKFKIPSTPSQIPERLPTFVGYQAEDICALVRDKMDRCIPGMRALGRGGSSHSSS